MDRFLGKRLDGRYELREIIGVGGMAVVYKAYDNIEDRIVAVKILKEEYNANEEFLRRFRNESKAIAVLSHPNIVKVFDVSFGVNIQYIVMEYIDGITLKEFIAQEGSLNWKDAVHLTVQILRGLQHAHDKGIVHRDVKPQNIMVLRDGTIKVTDFGIARFARSEQKTITDKAIGSVHYISPEQARGENTNEKADIYSVGVMLYEMLTGQLPFQAESAVSVAIMQMQRDPVMPRDVNGSIPLGLEQITLHAMEKDAVRRYKTAAEMLCDVDEFRKDPAKVFEYSYFVDTEPTKYVEGIMDESELEEEEEEQKSPIIPILTGVAIAFVVAVAFMFIWLVPKLFSSTGSTFACENFIGMTYSSIEGNEKYDNYQLEFEWHPSSEYDYGIVYWQSIDPKKPIKANAKCTLYVSTGEKTVSVPNITGYTQDQAEQLLKREGFIPTFIETNDEEVEKGQVIRTVPAAGKNAYAGSEITVYISLGKPTVYVDLPNVVGLYEGDAKKTIEDKGLKVLIIQVNSSKPQGVVVSQSPNPSTESKVGEGSTVTLEVSTGTVENTVNFQVAVPSDYLHSVGYVSIWSPDGTEMRNESGKINLRTIGSFGFSLTTESDTVDLVVKLSPDKSQYDAYSKITVDCKTGAVTVNEIMEYPKQSEGTNSNTSSEGNPTDSTPVDTSSSDSNSSTNSTTNN